MWIEWSWWVLLIVVPAWFVGLVLHEASHLLVGYLHERRRPTGFYPYPHFHNGKFYFARYQLGPGGFPLVFYFKRNHLPRHIAPMWMGLLVFLVLGTLILIANPAWRLWLIPSAVFGLGDILFFWWGYFFGSRVNDGKRWRYGDGGMQL